MSNCDAISGDSLSSSLSLNWNPSSPISSSTSSKHARCELPHEILATEVLPRLPAESLHRFRKVCKSWSDLITNPDFIETQLLKQQSQGASISNDGTILSSHEQINVLGRCIDHFYSIVARSGNATFKRLDLDDFPLMVSWGEEEMYPRLWNSCNGLICVETEEGELSLYNPCTQSHKTLPRWSVGIPNPNSYTDSEENPKSGDDGRVFNLTFGFGYDAKTKEYKVVRIGEKKVEEERVLETHVFTMGTNSWRRILDNDEYWSEAPGRFVNGFVYWHAMHNSPNEVFRFDIHDEVFSELCLPDVFLSEDDDGIICRIEIGELGGCLALVRELGAMYHHELWVLKENWVKMYSIDISGSVWAKFHTPFIPVGSVSIDKNKNNVEIVYLSSNGRLFSYNPSTNQFRSFRNQDYHNLVPETVVPYVESLVLLDE